MNDQGSGINNMPRINSEQKGRGLGGAVCGLWPLRCFSPHSSRACRTRYAALRYAAVIIAPESSCTPKSAYAQASSAARCMRLAAFNAKGKASPQQQPHTPIHLARDPPSPPFSFLARTHAVVAGTASLVHPSATLLGRPEQRWAAADPH